MKSWDAFHPYVLLDVPGASIPLVNQKLCLAAREFCQRTAAWEEWSDPITATVTTGELLDFDIGQGQELIKVIRARIGTEPDVSEIPVLTDDREPSRWHKEWHKQRVEHVAGNESFTLYVAQLGQPVKLLLALKPSILGSTGVGDVIVDRYADKVALKALSMLQVVPGQTFTNPDAARINAAAFEKAVHSAANETFRRRIGKKTAKVAIA